MNACYWQGEDRFRFLDGLSLARDWSPSVEDSNIFAFRIAYKQLPSSPVPVTSTVAVCSSMTLLPPAYNSLAVLGLSAGSQSSRRESNRRKSWTDQTRRV